MRRVDPAFEHHVGDGRLAETELMSSGAPVDELAELEVAIKRPDPSDRGTPCQQAARKVRRVNVLRTMQAERNLTRKLGAAEMAHHPPGEVRRGRAFERREPTLQGAKWQPIIGVQEGQELAACGLDCRVPCRADATRRL
jgi:hypothetical protein